MNFLTLFAIFTKILLSSILKNLLAYILLSLLFVKKIFKYLNDPLPIYKINNYL